MNDLSRHGLRFASGPNSSQGLAARAPEDPRPWRKRVSHLAIALGVTGAMAQAPACNCGDDTTGGSVGGGGVGGDTTSTQAGPGGQAPSTTSSVGGAGATTTTSTSTADGGSGGGGGSNPGTTCKATKSGTSGLLLKGTVLAPDSVIAPGQVLVDAGGTILCVAADCSADPAAANAGVVECPDGVISPGLINPHDHITFANNEPKAHGTERYEHRHDWRKGNDGHTAIKVNSGASADTVRGAELRFVMSGATTAASAGGQKGLLRNTDTPGLSEGLAIKVTDSDTFPLGDSGGKELETGCSYGTLVTESDIDALDGYLPHVAEGIDKSARNEFLCLSQGKNDIVAPQTSIVHAIGLLENDLETIRANSAGVVWSPRSNVDLYGNTASVTVLHALGVPIALGTDWVASGSMNLSRELACADELNTKYFGKTFSDQDLWRMVTTNAAFAIGAQSAVGMLKPGLVADIAIFDGATRKQHRAVVGAETDSVVLVLRGGQPLYGDAELVASTAVGGADCEVLDVCGRSKRACVKRDIPATSLDKVRAAIEASYPLFFCGVPQKEPSCVPFREEYKAGITADDDDGDGVPDASDDCPTIFNPVRPLDGAKQADFDADGQGDACDACPAAAGSCAARDSNDVDLDGVTNAFDNCPDKANADQSDGDKDGVGDACTPNPNDLDGDGVLIPTDNCPTVANPDQADVDADGRGDACDLPATSIVAIRDKSSAAHPAIGAQVLVENAFVTAVRPDTGSLRGFYVEDGTGSPFSGIFVFTGGKAPGVKVGNKVSIIATYDEFQNVSELVDADVTIVDAGTTLPFGPKVVADPADLATGGSLAEPLESMLVQIADVSIVVQNPDAPKDFDEFTVTGNLRVDDILVDVTQNAGLDNACAVGQSFTKMVGVMQFTFSNSKLAPRSKADVTIPAGGCDPFTP